MTNETTWGKKLTKYREMLRLKSPGLSEELSLFGSKLSSNETENLKRIGSEFYVSMDRTALWRLEKGKPAQPPRARILFFIYFFIKKGVISDPSEATDWLELANYKGIRDKECEVLFGYPLPKDQPGELQSQPDKLGNPPLEREPDPPFLSFHKDLIDTLYKKLAIDDHSKRLLILHGPFGMGKSGIARAVYNRLK